MFRTINRFRFTDVEHDGSIQLAVHTHPLAALNLVVSGVYPERFGRRDFEHWPGSLLYKPAGMEHSNNFARRSCRSLIIDIEPSLFDSLHLNNGRFKQAWALCVPSVSIVAQPIFVELLRADRDSDLVIAALAAELLGTVGCDTSRRKPKWLGRVIAFLIDHWLDFPTIDQLAVEAGVCPTHFARAFRMHVGCTPGEFLRHRRVCSAVDRIRGGTEPLSAIANRTGFADQSHMTRTLRRMIGATPAELRQLFQRR